MNISLLNIFRDCTTAVLIQSIINIQINISINIEISIAIVSI